MWVPQVDARARVLGQYLCCPGCPSAGRLRGAGLQGAASPLPVPALRFLLEASPVSLRAVTPCVRVDVCHGVFPGAWCCRGSPVLQPGAGSHSVPRLGAGPLRDAAVNVGAWTAEALASVLWCVCPAVELPGFPQGLRTHLAASSACGSRHLLVLILGGLPGPPAPWGVRSGAVLFSGALGVSWPPGPCVPPAL